MAIPQDMSRTINTKPGVLYAVAAGALLAALLLSGCATTTAPIAPATESVSEDAPWGSLIAQANAALLAGSYRRAVSLFEASLSQQPRNADVLFKLGELHDVLGDPARARRRFMEGLQYAESASARSYVAYLDIQGEQYDSARRHLELALQTKPGDLYALTLSGVCHQQLGDPEKAIELLAQADALDPEGTRPETQNLAYYLGMSYRDLDDLDNAIAAFARAELRMVGDPRPIEAQAAMFERAEEWEQAKDAYERAFAFDTSNTDLLARAQAAERRLSQQTTHTEDVEPVPAVSILSDDIQPVIDAAAEADRFAGEDAVILLNRSEHEILPDGRSRFTTHQLVKLLGRRAFADYGEIAIPFNAVSQNIGVNIARTILPTGEIVEVAEDGFHDVTPPESLTFNLYSDVLWKVVSFPALVEGAIVEYQVTVEDAYGSGDTGNIWFWGGMAFQSKYPTLRSEYALRVPKDVAFAHKLYGDGANVSMAQESSVDGPFPTATYVWSHGPSEAFDSEPNAPPMDGLLPRLAFSSVSSWQVLTDWYNGLLSDRVVSDGAVSEAVARVIGNARSQEERVRAIAYFVAQELRYVGIQLGKGAYQPHPAPEVLRHRYGDCKDKVALLIAMLRSIGVEAYPALIAPGPGEDVDVSLPTLASFSHMIVAIPDGDGTYVWFDPSNDLVRFGELSARNQSRTALVLKQGEAEWAMTPTALADDNRYDWTVSIDLEPDGRLTGHETLVATGTHGTDVRAIYQPIAPSQYRQFVEASLSSAYPSLRVGDVVIAPIMDLERPVSVAVDFTADAYGLRSESAWIVPIPSAGLEEYAALGASDTRSQPLELGAPNQLTQSVSIGVPDGYRVTHLPPPVSFQSDFARLTRQYRVEGDRVRYTLDLTIAEPSVSPEQYPQARELFALLARERAAQFVLEQAPLPQPVVEVPGQEPEEPVKPQVVPPVSEVAVESPPAAAPTPDGEITEPQAVVEATSPVPAVTDAEPKAAEPKMPAAAPERPSAPTDGRTAEISARIESWRTAWERRRLRDYLAMYAEDAEIRRYSKAQSPSQPGETDRLVWDVLSKSDLSDHMGYMLGRYRRIRVAIDRIRVVEAMTNDDAVTVEFVQEFHAWTARTGEQPTYADRGMKQFRFVMGDSGWMIAQERWAPLAPFQPTAAAMPGGGATVTGSSAVGSAQESQIREQVERWRAAWQNGDVDTYLASYARDAIIERSTVQPDGTITRQQLSLPSLASRVRTLLTRYSRVDVEALHLQVSPDGERADGVVARFEQHFRSWRSAGAGDPSYSDHGVKTLVFRRNATSWQIRRESWQPIVMDLATDQKAYAVTR